MKSNKARIVKNVVQAIMVVGLGYLVRHKVAETGGATVWLAAGWLLTAWVVLRLAMALKRGYANVRTHTHSGVNIKTLDQLTTASMPPWSRGFYQMEKLAYRGAWRTVTARPLVPTGEFSVAGGSHSAVVSTVALMLVAMLAGMAATLLPMWISGFWPRLLWFGGAGFALLYAAIWIVGWRRRLKEGGHRIDQGQLILDAGMRGSGTVALGDIARCSLLGGGVAQAADAQLWTISPGERPNVLIELTGETTLAIMSFGTQRDISRRRVALYVDQPAAFVDAVVRALAARTHGAAA
jgi:hypothetical protein